jgi:hypothetical protein
MSALRVFGVAFVVFTALAVHAACCFEDVLRVEAAEGSRLQNLGIIIHSAACGRGNGLLMVRYKIQTIHRPGREPDMKLKCAPPARCWMKGLF